MRAVVARSGVHRPGRRRTLRRAWAPSLCGVYGPTVRYPWRRCRRFPNLPRRAPPTSPNHLRCCAPRVRTARPKQWTKNVLVFAAPAAAGVLDERDHLVRDAGGVRRVLPRGERRPTSSTTPLTPTPTACTPRSGGGPSPPATSSATPRRHRRRARGDRGRDHRADQRRQAHRRGARLRRGHDRVHAVAQARARHRPRRGGRGLRVPRHRRRRRHRRADLRLVPHRRRRRVAVHGHRQAPRRAGRARRRVARAPHHARARTRPRTWATCARSRRA